MAIKEFVLDGRRMSSIDTFYDEVQRVLCPGFSGFGRNLDAFNDVLRGGFGTFEDGEKIRLRIVHRKDMDTHLPGGFVRKILSIMQGRNNVELLMT